MSGVENGTSGLTLGKGGVSVLPLSKSGASDLDLGKGGASALGTGKGGASALVLCSSLSSTSSVPTTGLGENLLAFLFNFRDPTLPKLSLGPFTLFLLALITAALLLSQLLKGSALIGS